MEEKIAMLDGYISKAVSILERQDVASAELLRGEIIAVYRPEIEQLTRGVSSYDWSSTDYLRDLRILKQKLENYKVNLRSGLFKQPESDSSAGISITQNVSQTTTVMATFDQTAKCIQEIPDNVLGNEEKELLMGKLAAISTEKDKSTKWDKIKGVLKWIGDKGIEVGIAALPYIAEALK